MKKNKVDNKKFPAPKENLPEKESLTQLDELKAFIDEYCLIRRKLLENIHLMNRDLQLPKDKIPLTVMSMISQHIEIAINVFEYYVDNLEKIEDELWDRINIQERMVFVLVLSIFEYVCKLYYHENKARLGLITVNRGIEKRRISLRDIINLSKSIHIMDDDDYHLWNGLLEFRNCIVHNNAFSSMTETYVFPSIKPESYEYPELKLKFKEGEAVEGSLLLFLHLINWTVDSIEKWICNITKFNVE